MCHGEHEPYVENVYFSVIATMPKWLTHDLTIDIIQGFLYAMLRTLPLRTLLVRENVFLRV